MGCVPLLCCSLQIIGAICGSLLAAGLLPGVTVGMGNGGPGCFDDTTISPDITRAQLFGWEVMMTFTLISVVYACGIAEPGHGSFTPLVVGLSLTACAMSGKCPRLMCRVSLLLEVSADSINGLG